MNKKQQNKRIRELRTKILETNNTIIKFTDMATNASDDDARARLERTVAGCKKRIETMERELYELRAVEIETRWAEMSRTEFFDIVKTHYPIIENGDSFTVKSKAVNWKEEDKVWVFPTLIDAKEKVLNLCDWREYEKFDRTSRPRVISNPEKKQKEEGEMVAGEDI